MNQSITRPAGRLAYWAFAAALVLMTASTPTAATAAETSPVFTGEKGAWHGFDRYDFVMDEATLSITPFKAPQNEGDGVGAPAKGERRCIVVVPKQMATGNPWSWQGCYWNHMPQTEIELLKHGFCAAYISADATLKPGKEWDAWYAFLTEQHGLSKKPAFVGMSRGGEYSYTWATTHPDKVSAQKLCNLRKNTSVETVPTFIACNNNSPFVSMMTRESNGANAGSLATVCQRCWFAPCLVLVRLASASAHVRVAMPLSVPARYALAIWRLSTGWRSAWFFASTICRASSALVVWRLVRWPVVLSTQ